MLTFLLKLLFKFIITNLCTYISYNNIQFLDHIFLSSNLPEKNKIFNYYFIDTNKIIKLIVIILLYTVFSCYILYRFSIQNKYRRLILIKVYIISI